MDETDVKYPGHTTVVTRGDGPRGVASYLSLTASSGMVVMLWRSVLVWGEWAAGEEHPDVM